MKANMGAFDGAFRTLIFCVSLMFAIMTGQWLWTIPAFILFLSAAFMWCPLYAAFGIHTNKDEMQTQ